MLGRLKPAGFNVSLEKNFSARHARDGARKKPQNAYRGGI